MALDVVLALSIKIVACLLGVFSFGKLPLHYKLLLLQTLIALFVEVLGYWLGEVLAQNNLWLFNIYALIELWIIGSIGILLTLSVTGKKLQLITMSLMTVYWCVIAFIKGLDELLSQFIFVLAIFFIIMYIYILNRNSVFNKEKVISQPVFLFSISIILYYVTIVPLFGLLNYLVENDITTAKSLFSINQFANYFRYSLTGLVFYLCARQVKGNTAELSDQ